MIMKIKEKIQGGPLDYLQALTPKYSFDTRKTWYFLQESFYFF